MLVLSRKVGERIVVPESGIVLTVLGIHGGHIRLGISAPPDVSIYREELWRTKVSRLGELSQERVDGTRRDRGRSKALRPLQS